MKNLAGIGLLAVLLAMPLRTVSGSSCTWSGSGTDGNWATAGNWSSCNSSYPGANSADTASINTGSKAITINQSITLTSITVGSSYSGTITQGSSSAVTLSGTYSQ